MHCASVGLELCGHGNYLTSALHEAAHSSSALLSSLLTACNEPDVISASPSLIFTRLHCLQANVAKTFGGGIFRSECMGDITSNTFTSNQAKSLGGGVYDAQVSLTLAGVLSCTVLRACNCGHMRLHAHMPALSSIDDMLMTHIDSLAALLHDESQSIFAGIFARLLQLRQNTSRSALHYWL